MAQDKNAEPNKKNINLQK